MGCRLQTSLLYQVSTEFGPRTRRAEELQPSRRWPRLTVAQYFDNVAVLENMRERSDRTVHPRRAKGQPKIRMDLESKIQRSRSLRKLDDISLGSENKNERIERKELTSTMRNTLCGPTLLVTPVCSNAKLCLTMHGGSTNLDLHEHPIGNTGKLRECRMHTAVPIRLRKGNVILKAIRDRMTAVMEIPKHTVALLIVRNDDTKSEYIVKISNMCHPFPMHFHEDAVGLFFAPLYSRLYSPLRKKCTERIGRRGKKRAIAHVQGMQLLMNTRCIHWVDHRKSTSFQNMLQTINAQPCCGRSKEMQNILTNPALLLRRKNRNDLQDHTTIAKDCQNGTNILRSTNQHQTKMLFGHASAPERDMRKEMDGAHHRFHLSSPLLLNTARRPHTRLEYMMQKTGNNHVFTRYKGEENTKNTNDMIEKRNARPMFHRTIRLCCDEKSPTNER